MARRQRSSSPLTVVIDAPVPDAQVRRLQALSPRIRLAISARTGALLPGDLLAEAEVIYTAWANFDPREAPRLRWVQVNTAAINHFLERPVMRSAIPVANATGAYTTAVAECALAMLLAVTRRVVLGCRCQSERRWPADLVPFQGDDLRGRTVGIVGYGSIGREIGRLACALGMTALACKRHPRQRRDDSYCVPGTGDPAGRIPQAWYGYDQLVPMLARSDIAMIALPLTPGTRGMIGRRALAALPRGSYVVNVGRGHVVDETALVERLRSGHLAGAAFDVFAAEPLPADSPLWDAPNLLVLPHIGSWTTRQAATASEVLIENVRRDLAGKPLLNRVDKKLHY